MANIYDIMTPFELQGVERRQGPAYIEKMMHLLPAAPVVDRIAYILDHCKGKHVLNLGAASGDLHAAIKTVASRVIGVDKASGSDHTIDLDEEPEKLNALLGSPKFNLVVAGELFEHLANPGNLLFHLRLLHCPVLITAPNAMANISYHWIRRGYEQVNTDHVAYYSWWTLTNLVHRYRFAVHELAWYNGKPGTAEGLIVLTD
jgi:hypothetical protein